MTFYLAHATGFCAGVWGPVLDALGDVDVVAWDFAGHGSGPELEAPVDWRVFGSQVLDETEPGGVGIGHSMGGAALVMAQLADPNRFRALVLVEPIIFPGPHHRWDHPLSLVAMRRKREFSSRAEAMDNFVSRSAFATWEREALQGYVECGLVGDGPVHLACDPEIEADIYRGSSAHDTFDRMVDVSIPVLVLAGEDSDTISPDLARSQAARFVRAGVEIVADAGHFLPMERPGLVAERALRLAAAVR